MTSFKNRWKIIQEELNDPALADIQYQKLLDKALTVITNPIAIWDLNRPELVQLLIQVCFNGKIYYKKKEWLHTPDLSVIYTTFEQLNALKTPNLEIIKNNLNTYIEELSRFQVFMNLFKNKKEVSFAV